jgi:hypothetical protein
MHSSGRIALRGLKFAMYTSWALAALAVLFWIALGLFMDWIGHGYLDDASAVNARGDEVTAKTERSKVTGFRTTTLINLKQAHHWFATDLLKVKSDNYLVGFRWRGDDRLVLTLDFGCSPQMTEPVQRVGPIEIVYRFDRTVIFPNHGYSSFQREARAPCQ